MYLLDSDFLYSYFFENQSTHDQSIVIMDLIVNDNLYVCNLVLQELASVLSHKETQSKSIQTIHSSRELGLSIINLSEIEESEIWELFDTQSKNKISFIDCTNLYLATKYNLKIASFDKFYPTELLAK
jgi:predicted nucleic acid-binding protein